MTKLGNEPAYPTAGIQNNEESLPVGGLTKREYFALHILNGMFAFDIFVNNQSEMAKSAVVYADALLAELSKGQE